MTFQTDPEQFPGGLVSMDTDPSRSSAVWTPDFWLYNTGEKPLDQLAWTSAEVYSDGLVNWSKPGLLKITCDFDLADFPFDKQDCYAEFGSWVYHAGSLRMLNGKDGLGHKAAMLSAFTGGKIDFTSFEENEEWVLRVDEQAKANHVVVKKLYGCCPYPYESWKVHLALVGKGFFKN